MAANSGDSHAFPIYNARYRVVFPILNTSGALVAGATSLDSELSQDQGTFADATNEATQIATSSGMYYLDLIATEMDTKSTTVIVKSAEGVTTPLVLYPVRMPVIRTGTAAAGGSTSITLDASASPIDDHYNGCWVNCTNDSPSNVRGQARQVIDYVGSTQVATVDPAWGTNPTSATTFEVLVPVSASVAAWAGAAMPTGPGAGLPDVNLVRLNNSNSSLLNIERSASVIWRGAVTGATTTTTLIDTSLTQSATDFWKGRIVIFTSGTLAYQASDITAFDPATDKITFTAMTAASAGADTYVIV